MAIYSIFPTPVLHESGVVPRHLLLEIENKIVSNQKYSNEFGDSLQHTNNLKIPALNKILYPLIDNLGYELFGQSKKWFISQMWGNIMTKGGYQHRHSHSNSFISGVVYIKLPEGSPITRFHKRESSDGFHFSNSGEMTEYNSQSIEMGGVVEGDVVLFPSYLIHDVPQNQSEGQRITVAFNAIPDKLDQQGYSIKFSQ